MERERDRVGERGRDCACLIGGLTKVSPFLNRVSQSCRKEDLSFLFHAEPNNAGVTLLQCVIFRQHVMVWHLTLFTKSLSFVMCAYMWWCACVPCKQKQPLGDGKGVKPFWPTEVCVVTLKGYTLGLRSPEISSSIEIQFLRWSSHLPPCRRFIDLGLAGRSTLTLLRTAQTYPQRDPCVGKVGSWRRGPWPLAFRQKHLTFNI